MDRTRVFDLSLCLLACLIAAVGIMLPAKKIQTVASWIAIDTSDAPVQYRGGTYPGTIRLSSKSAMNTPSR